MKKETIQILVNNWLDEEKRPFDIENVPKTIIDSFCKRQITWNQSKFTQLALYPDDNLDFIRVIQIAGKMNNSDSTKVEIFGCVDNLKLTEIEQIIKL